MNEAKEEVRERLAIEDVIGEYVQLKRTGRNWKGLSPFTSEKTPSFIVSPDKQIWHDFSSNRGGDVFSFVMEMEGMEFREALELLARKAGVDLGKYGRSDGTLAKRKKRLYALLDQAAQYYQHSLLKNKHALEYVARTRGFSKETVANFRIGYAPNTGRALRNFLDKKGYAEREMRDAGLLNTRGDDMFRGRMMVPLSDAQGAVVGFTARLIEAVEGAPKYINTPSTLLYDKGRQLFGFHLAKEAIRKNQFAVLVEGNLDVVSSHQVGERAVVAVAGTALTEMQLKSIGRLTPNVRLAFDGDAAGVTATERAIELAQKTGITLSVITLPDGVKDPDEAIQKDRDIWTSAIADAQPAVEWVIAQYARTFDVTTAEGKRRVTSRALSLIRRLEDAVEREHYLELLARITSASRGALEEKMSTIDAEAPARRLKKPSQAPVERPKDAFVYQDSLLALAAKFADTRTSLKSPIAAGFAGEQRQRIAHYLFALGLDPLPEQLPESLREDETYVKILLLRAEERYGAWDSQDHYVEAAKLARDVVNEQKRNRKNSLIAELRQAEETDDDARARQLRAELNKLIRDS